MLDIKFLRENPDKVKENIKKKFQDEKIELVDKVIELDKKSRELKANGDNLRSERKKISDEIGLLFRDKKIDDANKAKEKVQTVNKPTANNKDPNTLPSSPGTKWIIKIYKNPPRPIDNPASKPL